MSKKKRHVFWNLLLAITLFVCAFAFTIHYKNWHSIKDGKLKILSGIYYQTIVLSKIDSVSFVKRIPEMERANGFSWLQREKGVFQDSLTNSKIYVFVDDLRQPKIRLLYNDSLTMFLNFNDSLVTQSVFKDLSEEVRSDLKLGD
ncbi:MAG: hypothetical protein AAF575_11750 [Bacteroidota bacterium]